MGFQRKTVNSRQDVSVPWFPRFQLRRSLNVSAQLIRRKSVNPSPRRFAVLSINPMRFAPTDKPPLPSTLMTSSALKLPQGSVRLPQGKNALMLLNRFQDKLSRLNAKLSSLRCALALGHNPEVDPVAQDMETKQF